MLPDGQNRKGYVSGAIKNKISLEKTFLKTYVQLSQAKSDPMLRSNVLLVDRLAYPEYDCQAESIVKFWNELSDGTREQVENIAKWNYSQFKGVVDTTALWILNNHKLRRFIFYMSTFRERRASIEQARRENL